VRGDELNAATAAELAIAPASSSVAPDLSSLLLCSLLLLLLLLSPFQQARPAGESQASAGSIPTLRAALRNAEQQTAQRNEGNHRSDNRATRRQVPRRCCPELQPLMLTAFATCVMRLHAQHTCKVQPAHTRPDAKDGQARAKGPSNEQRAGQHGAPTPPNAIFLKFEQATLTAFGRL